MEIIIVVFDHALDLVNSYNENTFDLLKRSGNKLNYFSFEGLRFLFSLIPQ